MHHSVNPPAQKPHHLAINYAILALLLCLVAGVLYKFDFFRSDRTTDNAQVRQHIVPVNSRVQGYLQEIDFREFAHVQAGDVLAVIDDREHTLRLRQAEAGLATATSSRAVLQAVIETTRNNLSVADSGISELHIRLENARADLRRYTALLAENVVTQSQFDRAQTETDAFAAKHQMLQHQRRTTELMLAEQTGKLAEIDAQIALATAAVDLARLQVSYTRIVAPCSGVVGRQDIQPGQLIQPGQTLVTIVDDAQAWVIANFKERRTAQIVPGAAVRVEVDALPGEVFEGRVATLAQATGSAYALVPSDNAAGNFVKIQQLIPVRIEFTAANGRERLARLKSGMSAVVTIAPAR